MEPFVRALGESRTPRRAPSRPARGLATGLAVAFCLATPLVAAAQGRPYLVKDINPTGAGVGAQNLAPAGSRIFFAGNDRRHGFEPWVTDGTAEGTVRAADVRPGRVGSDPADFVDAGDFVFFQADDGTHGRELWRSDGTEVGTSLVADILQGERGSFASPGVWSPTLGLLFFVAFDNRHGLELWVSDGTAVGTRLVSDIDAGDESASIREMVEANGIVYFAANDGIHGDEVWKSDGTPEGTVLVADIFSGEPGSTPFRLSFLPTLGLLMFTADDGEHGYEPWLSDGTPEGTRMLADLEEGYASSFPTPLELGGVAYLVAQSGSGSRLWRTNGTATVLVKDLTDLAGGLYDLVVLGDDVFLTTVPTDNHRGMLWKSDGSVAGTVVVHQFDSWANPRSLMAAGDRVFFVANQFEPTSTGDELWTSDGTDAGTHLVKDVFPGERTSDPQELVALADVVLFAALSPSAGREIWRSDGTADGTTLVKDVFDGGTEPSVFGNTDLVELDGQVLFSAFEADLHQRLWSSDGTAAGTARVAATEDLDVRDLRSRDRASSWIYFWASDGVHWFEPWRTDLTPGGTWMLADVAPGPSSSDEGDSRVVGDTLYFAASRTGFFNDFGWELWRSDGTPAGTSLVRSVVADRPSTEPRELTALKGTILFSAGDTEHRRELWRSDGTAGGTQLVLDIAPGLERSRPQGLVALGSRLLFCADDTVHGRELWRSDGTAAGTEIVKDIRPGPGSGISTSYSPKAIALGAAILFAADDGVHGGELWRSDGTADGTFMVKDIFPGEDSSGVFALTRVGARVVFTARSESGGDELWRSDGTEAGTVRIKPSSSEFGGASSLVAVNGVIYFGGYDEAHGYELWRSDGTDAGTTIVRDLQPGPESSYPRSFLNHAGQLFFLADDGRRGSELWALTCGNGVVEADEQCDDGARNGGRESCCRGDCHLRTRDADSDGDGLHDRCDADEGALELTYASVRASSAPGTPDATIRVRGSLDAASGRALAFDASRGLAIAVADGAGALADATWPALRCRAVQAGGVRCASRDGRRRVTIEPAGAGAGAVNWALKVDLGGLAIAGPRVGPVSVRLTRLPSEDRSGTIDGCTADADSLVCGTRPQSAARAGASAGG